MYNLEKAYNVTNIQKSNISLQRLQRLFYVVSPLTTGMFSKSDIFLKKPQISNAYNSSTKIIWTMVSTSLERQTSCLQNTLILGASM